MDNYYLLKNWVANVSVGRRVGRKLGDRQYLEVLGAILLRAGHFEEARTELELALNAADNENTSSAYIQWFLAMVAHHLGDHDAAAEHLEAAQSATDAELADSPVWNRRLTLELLRDEATALLETQPDNPTTEEPDQTTTDN